MMKRLLVGLLGAAMVVLGQGLPKNVYSAGTSYNPAGSPKVSVTALQARLVQEQGTYMFAAMDILPVPGKPGLVTSQLSVGLAARLLKIKDISIFAPTSAGVSTNGDNMGWAWTTGWLLDIPFGKFRVQPIARVVKSSVSGGAGHQLITGVLIGWGE